MTGKTNEADLTKRSSFTHWTPVTIRFGDQDPLGHVNNVSIGSYVEVCRTQLIHKALNRDKYPNLNFALVHVEIDYLAEFTYPGTIDVGGRIQRIGTKSFSSGYGLFLGDTCVATAGSVNVFFDTAKRAAVEPPDDVRELLEKIMAGQP